MSAATSRRPVPDYQGFTLAIGLGVFATSLTMVLGVVTFFEGLVAATGLFILTGNRLARGVGVAIVSLSALANFLWIPYYPLWAMTVLALDVAVIWALTNANLGDS